MNVRKPVRVFAVLIFSLVAAALLIPPPADARPTGELPSDSSLQLAGDGRSDWVPDASWSPAAGGLVTQRIQVDPRQVVHQVVNVGDLLAPDGAPLQCTPGGIGRIHPQNFEDDKFPKRGDKWRSFDYFASLRGQNDPIKWGRVTCEQSEGAASLWSVGAGLIGSTLDCAKKEYPTSNPVHTDLQYVTFDFSTVPYGMRITLDYKAKMPDRALFVGAGNWAARDANGSIAITGRNDFKGDTKDAWVRGDITNLTADILKNTKEIILVFKYADPAPNPDGSPGTGNATAGMYGAFIDNVLVDALFSANPCAIPSPTAKPTTPPTPTRVVPTDTEEPPTRTPFVPPTRGPTLTPAPTRTPIRIRLPLAMRYLEVQGTRVPPPTAPTPSVTPVPSNTPVPTITPSLTPTITRTPTKTKTPFPSDTPTQPPTPTYTPEPNPDVRITFLQPFTLGGTDLEIVRVTNQGTGEEDLSGWRIYAEHNSKSCTFPRDTVLGPNQSFEFQSGRDAKAVPKVSGVCDTRFIWDNNLDKAELFDNSNRSRDVWCYDRDGPFYCGN